MIHIADSTYSTPMANGKFRLVCNRRKQGVRVEANATECERCKQIEATWNSFTFKTIIIRVEA